MTLLVRLPLLAALVTTSACNSADVPDPALRAQPLEWTEAVQVAVGQAYRGPWRMNDSESYYVDDPAVALTPDGAAVVWVDNAAQNVYFQRYTNDGLAVLRGAVNVSGSAGTFSWLPRLVVTDHGQTVIVVWQEIRFTGGTHGGEILAARSTDGGRSFTAPVNLSSTTAGAGKGRLSRQRWDNGSLDVAYWPDGRIYVAWTEYEGALRLSWSDDNAQSFVEPIHVAGDDNAPARGPSLAAGPDGRVWLAWTTGEAHQADVLLAWSDDVAAGFTEPRPVRPSERHADAPKLAIGDDRAIHLVYTLGENGPFSNSRIVHTRSLDGGVSFSSPADLVADRKVLATYPQLAVAGERVIVTWEQGVPDDARPTAIGISVSSDGGDSFSPPGVVPGTEAPENGRNGGNQGLLMRKLDVDDAGRVALGHATWRDGQASRIWLLLGRYEQL